ncbi:DUF359 domain-containing protein [Candidatus Micrarchaeota archaeon]|nr:DUF359 domain-containing protein [Candidatus Micrarchaeota archaeon]MBU1681446.1 DUF359 domain-containing protein [Candidatus Micrarchaeota archaeon]
MQISQKVKEQLKQPLGELHIDFKRIKELSQNHRIISIGDVCTLGLLVMGIRPHLAVFDHKFMRMPLETESIEILKRYFKDPKKYSNPAGTISDEISRDAKKLIEEGGSILIDGEEDLTALIFILNADENDIIVYGQPKQGIVIVNPDKKIKEKINKLLSA